MPGDRRLAAIFFSDIVGYTSLMGEDERKAFALLHKNKSYHRLLIKKFDGKFLKEMGDGILASFPSATKAVLCAIKIQRTAKKENISLRIGVHEGEVVFDSGDVLGDGVNVASRLQEAAQPGCIYLSEALYQNIKNKPEVEVDYIGEKSFKNVTDPVKVYNILYKDAGPEDDSKDTYVYAQKVESRLKVRKWLFFGVLILLAIVTGVYTGLKLFQLKSPATELEKSIAVLPFDNMSSDPDQEAMCDGITEEIIHHLSQIDAFEKVISRTSIMKFKDSDKTIKEIAEILDVTIILEGSYRESGNQIRITTQLIDAKTDNHVWSEIYERPFGDIFNIQSDIAKKVANQLKIQLTEEEKIIIDKEPELSEEAYKLINKAKFIQNTNMDYQGAIKLLNQALELNPNSALIYATIGSTYLTEGSWYGNINMHKAIDNALPYAKKALELDPNHLEANDLVAQIKWWTFDFVGYEEHYSKYHDDFNPGFYIAMGRYDEAISRIEEAIENNPDRASYVYLSFAHFIGNQKEKSLEAFKMAVLKAGLESYDWLGMICVFHERYQEAISYFEEYIKFWTELGNKLRPMDAAWLGIAYYKSGNILKSDSLENDLISMSKNYEGGTPKFFLGLYYSGIGNIDDAFKWLEESYKVRDVELYWLKVQPVFDILRDDPRYDELYREIGFEAYDNYVAQKK